MARTVSLSPQRCSEGPSDSNRVASTPGPRIASLSRRWSRLEILPGCKCRRGPARLDPAAAKQRRVGFSLSRALPQLVLQRRQARRSLQVEGELALANVTEMRVTIGQAGYDCCTPQVDA